MRNLFDRFALTNIFEFIFSGEILSSSCEELRKQGTSPQCRVAVRLLIVVIPNYEDIKIPSCHNSCDIGTPRRVKNDHHQIKANLQLAPRRGSIAIIATRRRPLLSSRRRSGGLSGVFDRIPSEAFESLRICIVVGSVFLCLERGHFCRLASLLQP